MARRKDIELPGICEECKREKDDGGKPLVLTRWKERDLCEVCLYPDDVPLRLEDFMRQEWEKLI